MTDTPDTAAARVQAYVDYCAKTFGQTEYSDTFAEYYTPGGLRKEASMSDLRAVLAEHQQMRERLTAMKTEWTIGYHANDDTGETYYSELTFTEAGARHHANNENGGFPASRLVGEWQPADAAPAQSSPSTDSEPTR